ncbi:MAG: aminotransferase class I/II-fold pyridoxal phosphate-dependent enzyme [Actinomycetales bacterium]|nr:aminotransferase class I/II-fold pyridoxal phosphate-dependent enzyme [Actinomycetales bacterium]
MSEFLRPLDELHLRHSSKWRRFSPDVLPMHVAEMDYEIAPQIKGLLIDFVQRSDLGYLGPIPEVAEAFVGFATRHWNWTPDPKQIRIATDVSVGAVEVMRRLTTPGERVLINSPVYSAFYGWIREVGCEVADVPLVPDLETWRLDIPGIEAAFASGVKFYLFCSPHNPMGRVHDRTELEAIADLALKYGVTVISDEIHAPLTYADQVFTPWLAVSDAARETGIVVTAASKSFNLAGLKASIIITQSATMASRLSVVPPDLHWRSSLLGGFAMAEAFSNCDDWLAQAVAANRAGRDLLTRLMSELLPEVPYWVAQGGYLAWLDVSSLGLGENPANRILEEKRISLVPGVDHGPEYGQYVRINFATSLESIERTVAAIASYR